MRRRIRVVLGVSALAVSLALAAVVSPPSVELFRVSGRSMLPALEDGDRVLVTDLLGVRRGDLVVVRLGGDTLVKRVVGLPGEEVEIRSGVVRIDGVPLEPVAAAYRDGSDFGPLRLGDRQYFLLGDNRRVSVDSRIFGPVVDDAVVGRVVWRWHGGRGSAAATARSRR